MNEHSKQTIDVVRAALALAERDVDLGLATVEEIQTIQRTRFATAERKQVAAILKAEGKSIREIAKTTGASKSAVARDVSVPNGTQTVPNGTSRPNGDGGSPQPKPRTEPEGGHQSPWAAHAVAPPGDTKPAGGPNEPGKGASNKTRSDHAAKPQESSDDDGMPTFEEAEESHQQTLLDQACLFLERMTGETRQRFFAHIQEKYQ